jgi:hypothetical protein
MGSSILFVEVHLRHAVVIVECPTDPAKKHLGWLRVAVSRVHNFALQIPFLTDSAIFPVRLGHPADSACLVLSLRSGPTYVVSKLFDDVSLLHPLANIILKNHED